MNSARPTRRYEERRRAQSSISIVALAGALLVAACNGAPVATAPTPTPGASTGVSGPSATAVVVATAAATASPSTAPSAPASIAGAWRGTWSSQKYPGLTGHFALTFVQQGSALSGTISITGSSCISGATLTGQLTGTQITFGVVQGAETVAYSGTWSGASMSGTWTITHGSGGACTTDNGDWSATR
jgi:hypothetical protein